MKELFKSLFPINLHLFDEGGEGTEVDGDKGGAEEDFEDVEEDVIEEEEVDVDDLEGEEHEPEGEEEEDEDKPDGEVEFDEKQQAKVNSLIKTRLARAEAKLYNQLQDVAGVDLDTSNGGGEVLEAVKLWGFLKVNPTISEAVQSILDQFVNAKAYKEPSRNSSSAEQKLEVKEAMLDMRETDKVFAKNQKQILEWAEQEGYEINSKKALKQAFLAWKGANMQKELAKTQLKEQRKSQQKQDVRKKAVLQSGKNKSSGKLDYTKMSDRDILAAEGISLFTRDKD